MQDSSSFITMLVRSVLVILLFIFYVYYKRKRQPFVTAVNRIPGPKPWPVIGNVYLVNSDPTIIFKKLIELHTEFRGAFRLWLFHKVNIIVQRARDLENLLQSMKHHYKSENYRFLHSWMGLGLLTSKDEKWKIHRKVLTPAFHFNVLHEFLPIMNKNSIILTQCLAEETKATKKEGFDIFHYSSRCSLDIICESSMGTSVNAQTSERSSYVIAVNRMNDLLVRRYFTWWLRPDFIFNISNTKKEIDNTLETINNFTDKVITERREYLKSRKSITDNDNINMGKRRNLAFLDLLLAAEEEGSKHMTQKDIRDQVSTFMFEGHDTVSTAMSWALFLFGTYPEYQERIIEELNEVFGESGRAPDMADLANLKYLERCIKETLRLYPSVAFMERGPIEEVQLENHVIPPGCTVSINAYSLHRDPEFWPEPEKFDPDRFLPENIKGRHPYAYIPFSAGPRNCIGQKYALMEEKVVLSTVLRRFRIEAAHTRDEAKLQISIVFRPKNGLRIRLYDRESHPKLRVSHSH